jgi:plastocyanin
MHYTALALLVGLVSAADHSVTVGGSDFAFHPSSITAAKGDTVSFKIGSLHSVHSGSFGSPCVQSGFSSGGPFSGSGFNSKLFQVTINDTNPIYGFCGTPEHCQQGMVFAINAP